MIDTRRRPTPFGDMRGNENPIVFAQEMAVTWPKWRMAYSKVVRWCQAKLSDQDDLRGPIVEALPTLVIG